MRSCGAAGFSRARHHPEKGDAQVLVFSFSEGTPEQLRDELRSWASSSAEDVTVTGWHQILRIWRMHHERGQA